uniref:Uncharacterized protein n=1 Tax=Oryctolagus cuniculus TaxID=9986 RepID=A0A5F9D8M7_RABIT
MEGEREWEWGGLWTKLSMNLLDMNIMQSGLNWKIKKQLEKQEKKIMSEEHRYLPELKENEFLIEKAEVLVMRRSSLWKDVIQRIPEVERLTW